MKAILDRAKRTFGVLADDVGEFVLQKSEEDPRSESPSLAESLSEYVDIPSNFTFEKEAQIGPDAVLFSKSGVFFKYTGLGNFPHNNCTTQDGPKSKMDSHISVPGYLFVASRGSDFGTTLILNWVSTSALKSEAVMKQSQCQAEVYCSASDHSEDQWCSGSEQLNYTSPAQTENTRSHSGQSEEQSSVGKVEEQPRNIKSKGFSVSIDLFTTEIIRIFYRKDSEGLTTGELVIKCEDQEFKVFYFKNGGLEDLIQLLLSWKYLKHNSHSDPFCHTFTVEYPRFSLSKFHPLENQFSVCLTSELWDTSMDNSGRILDFEYLCKVVFFKGVSSNIRKEVWPIILKIYDPGSSEVERRQLKHEMMHHYQAVNNSRLRKETPPSYESLKKRVYEDVLRTDRNIPYYKGDDNPNLKVEMNLMMNYLHYKPEVVYAQGMTDFLAPMLSVLDDESMAFWCFSKFMESYSILKDAVFNIRQQIDYLRLLVQFLLPQIYAYLESLDEGLTLMFCHRWLLVYLKREFNDQDILQVWEACWTAASTKHFHLFVCVAIIAVYAEKAQKKEMTFNELMIYFNSLSLQMPVNIVLSQARGYLHQFSISKQVDCTLHVLMKESFWHQTGSPTLSCTACEKFGICSRKQLHHRTESLC